ncbi:copper resistance protein B [Sphingomonas sp. LB2R24]|uniref:copper resistance protein B n=1 Tax=Sphingomonas sorbitolis TaxID=3096165 RepID=UPI002FC96827
MNRVLALLLIGSATIATRALAQDHAMHGMAMPAKPKRAKPAPRKLQPAKRATAKTPTRSAATRKASTVRPTAPAARPSTEPAMPAMDHAHMPGMTMPGTTAPGMTAPGMTVPEMDRPGGHAGHDMTAPAMATDKIAPTGTAFPAGNAPAPPLPTGHFADRQFGAAAMMPARAQMMRESGAQRLAQVMFNLAEYQIRNGKDGYRWDSEGWFGGDIDRAVIKTEGSGAVRGGVEAAEVQALYSHAIGPYFDVQAGIRHDFAPSPTRSYATIGVEGLAPYMFDTEAAVFVSTKGDVLGRLEGWYDQRLAQRLVLQPRVEFNLAAQDIPETRVGAGLSDAELGLRLRYEIAREFAPYVGISYEVKTGRTADYARTDGKDVTTTSLVAGVRFWF